MLFRQPLTRIGSKLSGSVEQKSEEILALACFSVFDMLKCLKNDRTCGLAFSSAVWVNPTTFSRAIKVAQLEAI